MSKQSNTYKGYLDYQSEFDRHYACWANNHNGWAKMKKFNKRKAKRKIRNETKMKLKNEEDI